MSIIYMAISVGFSWQTEVLLHIKNQKQMQTYLQIKSLSDQCEEVSEYFFYPNICEDLRQRLKNEGYISETEFDLYKINYEKRCAEKVAAYNHLEKLLKLEAHIAAHTDCKMRVQNRIKDLLYVEQ